MDKNKQPPLHLAIIPDGNRRWAKEKRMLPWDGHAKAIENFHELTSFCQQNERINILTVWCFSTENWKRDPKEITKLMTMLEKYLHKEREEFMKQKTRFVHSGRKDRIPASLKNLMAELEVETKDHTSFTLHLAIDYGGKDEIIRALEKSNNSSSTQSGSDEITDANLRNNLDHPELPDLDIIIRSSGEKRTSNFFLWQSTYAEWFFLPEYFPDISTEHLEKVLQQFEDRKRRFGGS